MLRVYLSIVLMCIGFLCQAQVIFTERAILSEYDNYSEESFEKINTKIEETDSTYIITSKDGLKMYLTRDKSTYRLIGDEYDIISLDVNKYGYCTSEYVIDENGNHYKFQDRFYSKSKNKWIDDCEIVFLFKCDKNNYTNGERIVFKRISRK